MPDQHLVIRPGRSDDISTLQAIERDAAQVFRSIGYDFCAGETAVAEEDHERVLAEGAVFVAEYDAVVAGFILIWPIDGHAHIAEISVAQAHQKRGIGRKLIATAENWAREAGFNTVTLTTFRDVAWSAPFYASLGYREFVSGPYDPGITAIQAEERASDFSDKPRIAMKKSL